MYAPTVCQLALVAAALLLLSPADAQAQNWRRTVAAREQAVAQMPLLERPNRLGHIYGNNVRRLYYGRLVVNSPRYRQPVRRFFYLP